MERINVGGGKGGRTGEKEESAAREIKRNGRSDGASGCNYSSIYELQGTAVTELRHMFPL